MVGPSPTAVGIAARAALAAGGAVALGTVTRAHRGLVRVGVRVRLRLRLRLRVRARLRVEVRVRVRARAGVVVVGHAGESISQIELALAQVHGL